MSLITLQYKANIKYLFISAQKMAKSLNAEKVSIRHRFQIEENGKMTRVDEMSLG